MSSCDHRKRIIDIARSVVGLSAGNPATLQAFTRMLGVPPAAGFELNVPYSTVDGRTRGVSTCALVAREILHRAGVDSPTLEAPYVVGSGITDMMTLAQKVGAWRPGGSGYTPVPGDVIVFPGHVATVVEMDSKTGLYRTVDGGTTCEQNLQCIQYRNRALSSGNNEWLGVIESDKLPFRADACSGGGDIGKVLVLGGIAAAAYFVARRLLATPRFRSNSAHRAAYKCRLCGGAAHPATGSQDRDGSITCGPCTREFWDWVRKHQAGAWFRVGPNTPDQLVNFYTGEVRSRRKAKR